MQALDHVGRRIARVFADRLREIIGIPGERRAVAVGQVAVRTKREFKYELTVFQRAMDKYNDSMPAQHDVAKERLPVG